MALVFARHSITVYLDDEPYYNYLWLKEDRENNKIICKYVIKNENAQKRITISMDSNNRFIQATFDTCAGHTSVVNADDKQKPLIFDGLPSPQDETYTVPFVVSRYKALSENHGLKVKDMARAMSGETLITIYVNEAIIDTTKKRWYNNLWFFAANGGGGGGGNGKNGSENKNKNCSLDDNTSIVSLDTETGDDDDDMNCHENYLMSKLKSSNRKRAAGGFEEKLQRKKNNSLWAPVYCVATGPLLLTVDLIFVFV